MLFTVVSEHSNLPISANKKAYLVRDDWDDWFEFSTKFYLVVFDTLGNKVEPGWVKIGQQGLQSPDRSPQVPDEFDELGENFFSLGQSENYYESLNLLGVKFRDEILSSIRDMAKNNQIYLDNKNERVLNSSLLRSVSSDQVLGRFHRLSMGDARLTQYDFTYTFPESPSGVRTKLHFGVEPDSKPSTNIHVLIGRNGVGKTRCLTNMIKALTAEASEEVGSFETNDLFDTELKFSRLVSVSFSAFDNFEPPLKKNPKPGKAIKYSYIGLRRTKTQNDNFVDSSPKGLEELSEEFTKSVLRCTNIARIERWKSALKILESDPLFAHAGVLDLTKYDGLQLELKAKDFYKKLSSGHKIVLMTITRLVELVEERSLVLIDEPEAHLHPPLLSAFIRALSNLLIQRNGVAIVATHSPVVLQETPKKCVSILWRSGWESKAERPRLETFGESVGTLTSEIFGLEVTNSGFHKLLADWVTQSNNDYNTLISELDNQLGSEGQAIAMGLIASRNSTP